MPLALAFRLDLPHGRCVGVAIPEGPHPYPLPASRGEGKQGAVGGGRVGTASAALDPDLLAALDPQERAHLATLGPAAQHSFAAGRAALRAALADLNLPLAPILPGPRGAPQLPPGAAGSISHKPRLAVALAATAPTTITPTAPGSASWLPSPRGLPRGEGKGEGRPPPPCFLGIDLEELRPFRIDISRRVLTPAEQAAVQALPDPERTPALLARFCLKEAFYKAANQLVGRMIGFQEVAVTDLASDGTARFGGPFFEAHPLHAEGWVGTPQEGYLLATARVCAPS
jgi:4'-phosphopantetheinyl transferase EntD